jgi:hypothetical protein
MKYKSRPLLPLLTAAAATAVFVTYRSSMRGARETHWWPLRRPKADRQRRRLQPRHPESVLVAIHTLAWFSIESCMVYLL